MNKKGQSLVVFVILLPVFLILLAFAVDFGFIGINKTKLDDINKNAIKYLVRDGKDINTVKDVIYKNDKDIKVKISSNRIVLSKDISSVFGKIISLKTYKIVSDLSGRVKDGKLIIEKGK